MQGKGEKLVRLAYRFPNENAAVDYKCVLNSFFDVGKSRGLRCGSFLVFLPFFSL